MPTAVGLPSFLIYSYYFWKKDVESGYCIMTPEYYRDQEFQRIIYKVNQPYLRSGIQSAFTNFSIFDRSYLEALFGGKEFPDGTFIIDYIDEILEYQKAFMVILGKTRRECMMTFPVMTYALLRQHGKFVDEDFAKWCCKQNMDWADSNFFVSDDINSLSNCCFDGSQQCMFIGPDEKKYVCSFREAWEIQNNLGDVCVKVPCEDEWHDAHIIRARKKTMYRVTLANGEVLKMTDDHICVTYAGEKPTKELTVNDFIKFYAPMTYMQTASMGGSKERDGYLYYRVSEIQKVNMDDRYAYCFQMEDQNNPYFTLPNGVITHNCRLKSSIKDLGYVKMPDYSFTDYHRGRICG